MTNPGEVPSVTSAQPLAAAALLAALAAALLAAPAPAAARARQVAPAAPQYADAAAARLHRAAVSARERQERSVLAYRAVVRQRLAVAIRAPLKDRTLYRAETAQRVLWSQDGDVLIQVLGLREQTPGGVSEEVEYGLADSWFDPMGDRLLFGLSDDEDGDDDRDADAADAGDRDPGDRDSDGDATEDSAGEDGFTFLHPLEREHAAGYRFESGDTLTLSLPDGRSIQAVELRVIPLAADARRIAGTLWIEPRSGALVRAVWRLADTLDLLRDLPDLRAEDERGEFRRVPGLLKPWTVELRVFAVEYSLWDLEV
ncbi:MAG TPA: hypothetical protein VFQ22_12920, partial [Longimicrobiales bacterium]|nr:hypothetical protein [Longimicrobiales bacterium]